MANFDFDQAEGLRRMLAGARPRIVTFLSATDQEDRSAMLVNLCASLSDTGTDVVLLDTCCHSRSVANRLGLAQGPALSDLAQHACELDQMLRQAPQGFQVATLAPHSINPRRLLPAARQALNQAFSTLCKRASVLVLEAEFDPACGFALPAMAENEIVLQVSNSARSIKAGYALIKSISLTLGRRPFGILVTGASESEAKLVYDNMARAASRYLAVELKSMGSVPADEYVYRAARLGKAVIDAFPLAGASVAYRRLAGRLRVVPGWPQMAGERGGAFSARLAGT
ncbi:antiactivator of flagellar biosynthesis FleN protein [Massilia sp. W12]|uniref:MinD/ParA family ATP-binding protein n=1 Tax=Massilia sp. W12 TaxID=3126507 RepID=UPI0030D08411